MTEVISVDKILIVDDEQAICTSLEFALEEDYEVITTTKPEKALEIIKEQDIDLCLLDLRIGKVDGIEVLKKIKGMNEEVLVIMMTAYGSIDSSIEAVKEGAYYYLTKPLQTEGLFALLEQAFKYKRLHEKVNYLSGELEQKYRYRDLVGKSGEMQKVFSLIEKVKDVDSSVMITGDSGTGKELVARAIHFGGRRRNEHFEVVNCAAIPENLLESELFGYKKGAFTGATRDKKGKFELAKEGTLFLDEIGDMPMALQAKLLRVIQQKEITPLGAAEPIKLNLRMLCATNKDVRHQVEIGEFREDLYFRLNVVEVHVPSLNERRQDLPLLFEHFLHYYNKELSKTTKKISKEARECLLRYGYPGNVRELKNVIEHAMVMSEEEEIEIYDLPEKVREDYSLGKNPSKDVVNPLVGLTLEEVECKLIKETLDKNQGHRQKTAKMLGISVRGLRNKIQRCELIVE